MINGDGGDPLMRDGQVYARNVQASEKVYMDLRLEVHNPGGHSSLPVKDNAIYRLSAALLAGRARTSSRRGSTRCTRAYFTRAAAAAPDTIAARMRMVGESGDTAAMRRLAAGSPWFNAVLRTTCVATRLEGGHANNALPQLAAANVNCRMLPDERPDDVVETIRRVVADTAVHVTVSSEPKPSPRVAAGARSAGAGRQHHGGDVAGARPWSRAWRPARPTACSSGTRGSRSTAFPECRSRTNDIRAHGQDERIRVDAFYQGLEFTTRLVRALATAR